MNPRSIAFLILYFLHFTIQSQINPQNVTIARDKYGVPHIFAPTDAEVAYGLAWASAEDDFPTAQLQLLAVKGLAGRVKGKAGAAADIFMQFLELDSLADNRYEKDVSPAFKKILSAYAQGVNAYARTHPAEVMHKKLFPVNEKDILKGYVLGLSMLTHAQRSLSRILNGSIIQEEEEVPKGSNAFAISGEKTTDGKTYLAINSHQPLEGLNSWYEAHLCSEEGWNIVGANFVGGVSIFTGTNEHLGWAHTVNHADFADVFKLTMHPSKKNTYRFDGEWHKLKKKKAKTVVKLGFLKIPISKKYYESPYGLTLKTDNGYYALCVAGNRSIQGAEQWYRMNKATNFGEFKDALEMLGITGTNIVYADREDNIFYVGNARLPQRNPNYDWQKVLPGDTSATLWSEQPFPFDSLAIYYNPPGGYVFNSNNTPFNAAMPDDNIRPEKINHTMGYRLVDNNRSLRFHELIRPKEHLSYEDFKRIKYDLCYTDTLYDYRIINLDDIKRLDTLKYPEVAPSVRLLQAWNHSTDTMSVGATVFILAIAELRSLMRKTGTYKNGGSATEDQFVKALKHTQQHLMTHFGQLEVALGQVQRHSRGKVNYAIAGGPETLRAMYSSSQPNGQIRPFVGDSYIQLVRFSSEGVEIESINAYGASARPESPHFSDQMKLFAEQKTKVMTLDKAQILKDAIKTYHPQ